MYNWLSGESPISTELQRLKNDYIGKVREELTTTHPEDIPSTLLSLFTQNLFNDPVISVRGKVYDRAGIEQWLKTHTTDETRQPLTSTMIYPFPELNELIQGYQILLQPYKDKKELLLELARDAAAKDPAKGVPDVFICPISHKVITNPVISKTGDVFDQASVPLEIVKSFTEFDEYLKLFRWKMEKCEERPLKKKKEYKEQEPKMEKYTPQPLNMEKYVDQQLMSKYGSLFGQLNGLLSQGHLMNLKNQAFFV